MTAKIRKASLIALMVTFSLVSLYSCAQEKEPWRKDQLMEPAMLAKIVSDPSARKPIIFSIGPGGNIKGSIEMGAAGEETNLGKFKQVLGKMDKNSEIVIYCGCCPFEHCPNVRPAFTLLETMGFKSYKLLNLSHNLKMDWIDKNYPVREQ